MTDTSVRTLRQRQLNERREFYLEPKQIRLVVRDLNGESESFVSYESVTPTTRKIAQQDGRLYVIAISCGIFALVGFALNAMGLPVLMRWAPLWAIAAVILFGFHLYKRRRYLLLDLSNRKSIFFLADKPSRSELQSFIELIYAERRRYLREKYLVMNLAGVPAHDIETLSWLLREGAISEIEFREMNMLLSLKKTIE